MAGGSAEVGVVDGVCVVVDDVGVVVDEVSFVDDVGVVDGVSKFAVDEVAGFANAGANARQLKSTRGVSRGTFIVVFCWRNSRREFFDTILLRLHRGLLELDRCAQRRKD